MNSLVFTDDDLPYEEEIIRNPFSVKHWMRYIDFKKSSPKDVINMVFERALKELPGSYKLWYYYLKLRRKQVKGTSINSQTYGDVNNSFERALVFMHKMPRIWIDYCQFMMEQKKLTCIRQVFDRALRALPITQHNRIWPHYLKFVRELSVPETAVRIYRRYLKLFPEHMEEFIEFLIKIDRLDDAANLLSDVVNNEHFGSKEGKSNHQLWNELCELISNNPDKISSLKVDAIIRGGLRRYTDQQGHLWTSLAFYYTKSSLFERARDIYEEAIQTVVTVRDFSQVFDAYSQFEKDLLTQKLRERNGDELDINLRMARLEDLLERRPLLLNSVRLRQNPHDVNRWSERVKLLEGKPKEIIHTYTEAVQRIEPKLALGKLDILWVDFAKFYEQNGQLEDARVIFKKATQVAFTKVEELATIWCEWAEMEIRNENFEGALKLIHQATAAPPRKVAYYDQSETVQNRLYKCLKVWSLYADLEESFGTFKTTKAVYDRIIDLKIATPQIIINYCLFLEENNYFEEAFKAYEKGIALFKWPNVYDIWKTYLAKFLDRYGGNKLERARDLFEQCLEVCPAPFAKVLYLQYAKLEEEHGLARHAMTIYDRATNAVPASEKYELFNLYIKKAAEIHGVTYTRQIYEKSIEVLGDTEAKNMCLKYADLERKLGEIDRARGIYMHCSQMCDPRTTEDFWQTWKDFEVRHGNEDTLTELLRIKRSIQAKFNIHVNAMSAQMMSAAVAAAGGPEAITGPDTMAQLEALQISETPTTSKNIMFVRGEVTSDEQKTTDAHKTNNPDEIELDEDEDGEEEEEDVEVEQKSVPSQVFGNLQKDEDDDEEETI